MTPGQYHPGIAAAEWKLLLTAAFSEGAQRSVITGFRGPPRPEVAILAAKGGRTLGEGSTVLEEEKQWLRRLMRGPHRYVGTRVYGRGQRGHSGVHRERCAKVRNRNGLPEVRGGVHFECLSLDDGELVIDASEMRRLRHLRHGVPHVRFGIFESVGRRVEGRLPARRAR